jgi:hypothetical protein
VGEASGMPAEGLGGLMNTKYEINTIYSKISALLDALNLAILRII